MNSNNRATHGWESLDLPSEPQDVTETKKTAYVATVLTIALDILIMLAAVTCLVLTIAGVGVLLSGTSEDPWVTSALTIIFALGFVGNLARFFARNCD